MASNQLKSQSGEPTLSDTWHQPRKADQVTQVSRKEFIDLQRIFHEVESHGHRDDHNEVDIHRFQQLCKRFFWKDLLTEFRVIILSEAGSGKTTEMRNAALSLRNEGKPAFFLRLEDIDSHFQTAFEEGSAHDFDAWLNTSEEGWLFLDSVDEARLRHPKDFERAIRSLSLKIGEAMPRTHIFISSRTSAWRPKSDLELCQEQLPYPKESLSLAHQSKARSNTNTNMMIQKNRPITSREGYKIVTLADLDEKQIDCFVKTLGFASDQAVAFLQNVKRASAHSLTTRPLDLKWLAEYWSKNSRIGSGLEIIQDSIRKRLAEEDQNRAATRPLTEDECRQGCRLLAGATTMTHSQSIGIPDGEMNSKGIDIRKVLPKWADNKRASLLTCPIFDGAIYGLVRFHHRTVREYLCAEWLHKLLAEDTSRKKIEDLCFQSNYGEEIVIPTLRPILPWLAILDEAIRARACKIAPEVFFEGGDPSQLPLEMRKNILRKVCEQLAQGQLFPWLGDNLALQRFARPDLAEEVCSLLTQHSNNNELKIFLLRMAWLGELHGTIHAAMKVALDPSSDRDVRIYAFRAAKAIGSEDDQEMIRQSFLEEAPILKRHWLSELLINLQPTQQSITWLFKCLEKTETEKPGDVTFLAERIQEIFSETDIELVPQIIAGCNFLLSCPPVMERRYVEVSKKFLWLMAPAISVMPRLISARHPASLATESLQLLHNNSALRSCTGDSELVGEHDFSILVPPWKELNYALFWFQIQRAREVIQQMQENRMTSYHCYSYERFWKFGSEDFADVAKEISRQPFQDDKLVALSLAIDIFKEACCPPAWRKQLRNLCKSNDELSDRLHTNLKCSNQSETIRLARKRQIEREKRAEAKHQKQQEILAEWKLHLQKHLPEAREKLRTEPGIVTEEFRYLFQQAGHFDLVTIKIRDQSWQTLKPKYGVEIAEYFRDKMRALWRHHEPKLPSEGAPRSHIPEIVNPGLAGLNVEAFENRDWHKKLSETEVRRACKYAFFALGGFPDWFADFFAEHREMVSDLLNHELSHELSIKSKKVATHGISQKLAWSGQAFWDLIAHHILRLLEFEPTSLNQLGDLLRILQSSKRADDAIANLASQKCRTLGKHEHLARWFAVWTGVAPEASITELKQHFDKLGDKEEQTEFAMTFVTHLWGKSRGQWAGVRDAFQTPRHLKTLYLLMLN